MHSHAHNHSCTWIQKVMKWIHTYVTEHLPYLGHTVERTVCLSLLVHLSLFRPVYSVHILSSISSLAPCWHHPFPSPSMTKIKNTEISTANRISIMCFIPACVCHVTSSILAVPSTFAHKWCCRFLWVLCWWHKFHSSSTLTFLPSHVLQSSVEFLDPSMSPISPVMKAVSCLAIFFCMTLWKPLLLGSPFCLSTMFYHGYQAILFCQLLVACLA